MAQNSISVFLKHAPTLFLCKLSPKNQSTPTYTSPLIMMSFIIICCNCFNL